ncbi:MAG: hypothetical protein AAFR57_17335, partial [Pseudomonadota bacterium]
MTDRPATDRAADALAFAFTLVILIYAASGPLSDLVRWMIETTTSDFEELSRRDRRMLLREHWLGAGFKAFERALLLPTGLILGLPILFALAISSLGLERHARWLRWALAGLSTLVVTTWVISL